MRVVATSDFHGHVPPDVPACDLLLVGGDVLGTAGHQAKEFGEWLARQPAKTIVGVAGNHDFIARDKPDVPRALPWVYLENEAVVVEGLHVFGSPMAMLFGGWAYMLPDHELAKVWAKIPDETDVLLVHGPAKGVLDKTTSGESTGSLTLRGRLDELPKLKLFVCGHIHEAYGETAVPRKLAGKEEPDWLKCVNGSYMNELYRPGNPPIVIDL